MRAFTYALVYVHSVFGPSFTVGTLVDVGTQLCRVAIYLVTHS